MAGWSTFTCTDAVALWVAEKQYCPCTDFSPATGHYTQVRAAPCASRPRRGASHARPPSAPPPARAQVVWKGTTQVGCGWARCGAGVMVTCRYSPAGNILGYFAGSV